MTGFCLPSFCTPAFSSRSCPRHSAALSVLHFFTSILSYSCCDEGAGSTCQPCMPRQNYFGLWRLSQRQSIPSKICFIYIILQVSFKGFINFEALVQQGITFHLIIHNLEVSSKLDSPSHLKTSYSSVSLLIWSSNLLLILKTVLSRPKEMVWSCFFLLPSLYPGQASPETHYWVSDTESQQEQMCSSPLQELRRWSLSQAANVLLFKKNWSPLSLSKQKRNLLNYFP